MIIDASRPDAHDPDCPPVAVISRPLGIQTNNYAEYHGVILGLEKAIALGAREVELVLDSMLIVEQLSGRWKVKHPAIRPLAARAMAMLTSLDSWSIAHQRREFNRQADAWANLALDDPAAAAAAERGETVSSHPEVAPISRADTGPIGNANIGSAAAIFDASDRVLLVKHTYGNLAWNPPGGLALPGEEPSVAAARELLEETGLRLTPGAISGVYYEPGHDFGPMLHFVFRFDWDPAQTPTAMPPEIGEVRWCNLGDLPPPINDFTENRIRDAATDGFTYRVVTERIWRT